MRGLLGIDVMQSYEMFRHLGNLISPFSVVEREMENRRKIVYQAINSVGAPEQHLAIGYN